MIAATATNRKDSSSTLDNYLTVLRVIHFDFKTKQIYLFFRQILGLDTALRLAIRVLFWRFNVLQWNPYKSIIFNLNKYEAILGVTI